MSKLEFISPEGLRLDGRRPEELRKIKCKLGLLSRADGSAYYEQGNTKIMAAIYGPRDVTLKSKQLHDRAIINCEFSIASFSTGERKKRSKGDRMSTEFALLLRQTFEASVMTNLYPRSQIDIYVQILQTDGGHLPAAINAATLAIINAGIPMKDFICACSAGYIDGKPVLDLNYIEGSAGGPELPVAILPQSEKITMLQMDSKIAMDVFEDVLKLSVDGAKAIYELLKKEVEKYTLELLDSRGTI